MPTVTLKNQQVQIPQLHFVTIIVTAIVLILVLVLYCFCPPSKEMFFSTVGTALVGFLSGKLSNSFGKPILQRTDAIVSTGGDAKDSGDTGEASES